MRSLSIRNVGIVCGLLIAWVCAANALAQPDHKRTVIVDQTSTTADFTTIQAAINSLFVRDPSGSEGVWTILVYPGVYQEALTLGARKFIEIQGVARDSVVIKPLEDVNAITFAGGQLGYVGYRIADLTIRTNDDDSQQGDGVVFNFDIAIDPPPNPPTPNGIVFDNIWVALDGKLSDGFKAKSGVADVTLRGVTIRAAAFTSYPIKGQLIEGLKVHDCDFLAVDGVVELGNDAEVRDSRIVIDRYFGSAPSAADDAPAIQIRQASRVTIRNTYLESPYAALLLQGTTKTTIRDCVLRGGNFGISMPTIDPNWGASPGASDITIENCFASAESSRGVFDRLPLGQPKLPYRAVWVQSPLGPVTLRGCEFFASSDREATGAKNPIVAASEAVVVETDGTGNAPAGGAVVLEGCSIKAVTGPDGGTDATGILSKSKSGIIATNCTISARQTWIGDTTTPRKAYGVVGTLLVAGVSQPLPDAVTLFGGRITSFDVNEREADQFDIKNDPTGEVQVRVHGTAMSKWKGAIGSSERQRVEVQRMVSVAASSNTAILPAKLLTTQEQTVNKTNSALVNPDNYRVLTATLSGGTGLQTSLPVTIIGTNWGGEQIAETANVLGTAEFQKAFRTVVKVILPPRGVSGQQISIGVSSRLGLHTPVTDATDLLLVSKSVGGTAFLPESFNPADLDLVNHTLRVPTITAGAAYEITYRASE